MSILLQAFSVVIDHGASVPGHGREVLDGINYIDKIFIFQLISTMPLIGAKGCDTQMFVHTVTRTSYVIFPDNFKTNCLMWHAKME